jgi:hypothetical protein
VTCKLHFAEAAMEKDLDIGIHDLAEFVAEFL